MTWFYLLLSYGICFGIQNKVTFLHGKTEFTDALLRCTYCTGFHCGWMVWLLAWAMTGTLPAEGYAIIPSVFGWAFVSSAFCYGVDAVIKWAEANASTD